MIEINRNPTRRDLVVFAETLAAFLALAGFWALRGGRASAASALWAAAGGAAVFGPLAVRWAPTGVRAVYLLCAYAALPIGWSVSHLLLAAVYWGLLTPIGVAMRLLAGDPLQRRIDRSRDTYWARREQVTDPARYFRQF